MSPLHLSRDSSKTIKKDCEKILTGINDKINVLNNKFDMVITGLESNVPISTICKVQKEMMRKVMFGAINGKKNLRKDSQTKE